MSQLQTTKQKNYRDFTVGELLDKGFSIDIRKHGIERQDAVKQSEIFKNMKRNKGFRKINKDTNILNCWAGACEVTFFIKKGEDEA